ncbi:endospore germination permease [Bacillus tianshenii]|nr:endospore germination permease [Bacillus tianshenii]
MIENGKISARQFMYLVILFTIGSSILIVPSPLVGGAKQDAWIAGLFSVGVGLLVVRLYHAIETNMPNKTFVQISEAIFGRWFGKFLAFLFFSFTFLLAALVLRNIGDFMTTQILPETPLQYTHLLFLFVAIFGVKLGLEVIGRASELFLPWVIFLLLFLFVSLTPKFKPENLQPVFEFGFKPIISTSLPFIGSPFLELVVMLMLFPYVNNVKEAKKGFYLGTLIGGVILTAITLLSIIVIGTDLSALNAYPSYVLGKKIEIAGFLEGVEIIVAVIWMITIYFKLAVLLYASALGIAQIIELNDYKPLLYPLGMIMVVLSIISYPNVAYFQEFIGEIWYLFAATFGLFLPFIYWIGSAVKKRREKKA